MNYRVCSCERRVFRDASLLVEGNDISTYYFLSRQIRIQLLKSQLQLDKKHVNANSCLLQEPCKAHKLLGQNDEEFF
jgi:hypothetical protein